METSRRELAAMMLGGAGALVAPAVAQGEGMTDAPLVHHVFFWLKNAGSGADRDALIAGLRTLRGIPVIRALHIGVPAATEQRGVVDASYDVSELMMFGSLADQKAYQDHPLHLAFVEACSGLWRKVVVYDAVQV